MSRLIQVQSRVKQIEAMADDLTALAEKRFQGQNVQPEFSIKGQQWYRAARELLVQAQFSGIQEFTDCYEGNIERGGRNMRAFTDIERMIAVPDGPPIDADHVRLFTSFFKKARSLVLALEQEILSRELPVVTQLSFSLAADEFEKAELLFNESRGDEVLVRVSGVLARIALERHLFTVVDVRGVKIAVNPPQKKRADMEDVLNSLVAADVITAVKRSHLASLFAVANNCAHPKEPVKPEDVQRLIREGRAEAASIL
jgi:hypothetical protein